MRTSTIFSLLPLGALAAAKLDIRGTVVNLPSQDQITVDQAYLNFNAGQLSSAALTIQIQDLITGPPTGTIGTCSAIPIEGVTGSLDAPVFTIPTDSPFISCSPSTVQIQLSGSNEALTFTISHAVSLAPQGVVQRLATFSAGSIAKWNKFSAADNGIEYVAVVANLPAPASQNVQAPAGWTGDAVPSTAPVNAAQAQASSRNSSGTPSPTQAVWPAKVGRALTMITSVVPDRRT